VKEVNLVDTRVITMIEHYKTKKVEWRIYGVDKDGLYHKITLPLGPHQVRMVEKAEPENVIPAVVT
jgi:hypothetical protein